jgi:hypothetical protein
MFSLMVSDEALESSTEHKETLTD